MFYVNVGEDLHVLGAEHGAVTQEIVGDALEETLVGDARAAEDVDANEVCADGGGDGEGGLAVIPQHVDAKRKLGKALADIGGEGGHGGDRVGGNAAGIEGDVAEVFEHETVDAAAGEGVSVTQHRLADLVDGTRAELG